MRAGRLPEILCNEDIIVVGASGSIAHTKEFRSTWKLTEFAHRFPFTEVVKISPLKKDKLMVYVYDATAKALAEKRYKDVLEYADVLETHTFENDIKYIEASKTNLDKWTIEELLCAEMPFLSMNDITDNDWQILDFKLEKYDRANENYDLKECKILAFVLQQIHYDKTNFIKVPNVIRNGRKFQELVVKYNPELTNILFPTRASN